MSALSLDDAKDHLNITSDTSDGELVVTIDAAEAIVARIVGSLSPTSNTRRVQGCSRVLLLPASPVLSLTSVTPILNGAPLDLNLLLLDPVAGTVVYADGWSWFWVRAYDVVFDTGWDGDLPADLLYAVKEMVRHLWKTQRGGAQRPGSADSAPPPGYLIPNAVAELLEPYIPMGIG